MAKKEFNFEKELLALRGNLMSYAVHLCKNPDTAEDLVQEAMMRAFANRSQFTPGPGSSLAAWVVVILRNFWFTSCKKRKRELPDFDGLLSAALPAPDNPLADVILNELPAELSRLAKSKGFCRSDDKLFAAIMRGDSIAEVAARFGLAEGSIKVRTHRVRAALVPEVTGRTLKEQRAVMARYQPYAKV